MKKLFAVLSACLLSLCLLVSCGSKLGAVSKSLKDAGFNVEESSYEAKDESVVKSVQKITTKGALTGNDVVIGLLVELTSNDKIDEAIDELKADPNFKNYKQILDGCKGIIESSGLINGNVVLFTLSKEAITAFKEA